MNAINKILSVTLLTTIFGVLALAASLTKVHTQFTVTFGDEVVVKDQVSIEHLVELLPQDRKVMPPRKPTGGM